MKFTTTLLTSALLLASFTSAEIQPRAAGQVGHHSKVARSNSVAEKAARRAIIDADLEEREEAAQALAPKKRGCKAKSSKSKSKSSSSNSSSKSTDKEASKDSSSSKSKSSSSSSSKDSSSSKSDSGSSKSSSSSSSGFGKGLWGFTNSCGDSQASNNDPNGAKWWLNCGLDGGNGWNPANIKLSDIKVISDDEAAKSDTFAPCAKYINEFKSAHQSTGIPVAILMSIAMQESTCNPSVTGGRGEIGMMQITPDKCGDASNCYDTEFNIKKGGQYLADTIDSFGGNFVEALGQYNGWTKGMQGSGSCGPQGQNLDYINGNLNKWFQGKNGYGDNSGGC